MKPVLTCLVTLLVALTIALTRPTQVHGMWLFQQQHQDPEPRLDTPPINQFNQSLTERLTNIAAKQLLTQIEQAPQQNVQGTKGASTSSGSTSGGGTGGGGGSYSSYGTGLLSIAGIQPASLSALLGTVGDTSFRYFNIQDQCRNRAACDLGAMLYKKLSFVHNWLVRTSVRSLVDMNNIYMQSWMEGMTGRNCTAVYVTCHQSPLEGLMNLAMLQNLMY